MIKSPKAFHSDEIGIKKQCNVENHLDTSKPEAMPEGITILMGSTLGL